MKNKMAWIRLGQKLKKCSENAGKCQKGTGGCRKGFPIIGKVEFQVNNDVNRKCSLE
jgi:hypothetical protein